MCTVTYLPYRDGFVLTHNRDEAPTRSTPVIIKEKTGYDTLLFPRDAKAGGAWIAAARSGKTACLLNGAFEKHRHIPPYRRSRGLMLLDFFESQNPGDFFAAYELDGIEPFTLLFFQNGRAVEFRWDGARRHLKDLPPGQPHFWCSATLYPAPMRHLREQVFYRFLREKMLPPALLSQSPVPDTRSPFPRKIFRLHRTGSVDDPENNYVMNRGGRVQTVSITQVVQESGHFRMRYLDLNSGKRDARRMAFFSGNVTEQTKPAFVI